MLFGNVSAASVTNFFPTVVKTLDRSDIETLLLTCPPYILGIITTLLNAWHADRTGERFWHVTLPLWLAVICFIISAATTNVAARYVSIMLMVSLVDRFSSIIADNKNRSLVCTVATPPRSHGSATHCRVPRPRELLLSPSSMPSPMRPRSIRRTYTQIRQHPDTKPLSFIIAYWQLWLSEQLSFSGSCWRD